jgi:hypothetical protein
VKPVSGAADRHHRTLTRVAMIGTVEDFDRNIAPGRW